MQWFFYGLMAFGSMCAMAWFGSKEPKQTKRQKRIYGLLAVGSWLLMLVLANTIS